MTDRATCWSITINNPTDEDLKPQFPNNKWVMQGQMEQGEEGTVHYQGMLSTPQVRFSQVKKCLPRAHIEIAKNKVALQKYVSKTETRIASCEPVSSSIPTLFDYQHTIAKKWDDDDFTQLNNELFDKPVDEVALDYVDKLVSLDIENGMLGIEYIAINPMWRSSWKKFWRSIIKRERKLISESTVYQDGIQEEQESVRQEEEDSQEERTQE